MKILTLSSYDKQVFVIISIIAIITFIYDTYYSDVQDCLRNTKDNYRKIAVVIINFAHHFMSMFGLFGWLFDNKILLIFYISLVILTVIQWWVTGGECMVTKCIAILSDTPKYKRFNDLYKILRIRELVPPKLLYYGSLSAFIAVALYKLLIL